MSRWSRKVRIGHSGAVLEPCSGDFDVTVTPGEGVQAAVDRCPPGGCVLLLPGTHEGPLELLAGKEVHVFGRGRATLRTADGTVVTSSASSATLDGLIIRREGRASEGEEDFGVWIRGGQLRLHACDIFSFPGVCVRIQGRADPVLVACKCVRTVQSLGRMRAPPFILLPSDESGRLLAHFLKMC